MMSDGMVKKLLCLGDSITKGIFSSNYLNLAQEMLQGTDIKIINGGVNGDLSYTLNQRLESALEGAPDYITLLIGTNDILISSFDKIRNMAVKGKKLKKGYVSTKEAYIREVAMILSQIKKKSQIKVALFSIPILGEEINSLVNQRIFDYNEGLRHLAAQEDIVYLDLYTMQRNYLEKSPQIPGIIVNEDIYNQIYLAFMKHFFLRWSWDKISNRNKMQLTIEGVHLNSVSAEMAARLIYDFINKGDN